MHDNFNNCQTCTDNETFLEQKIKEEVKTINFANNTCPICKKSFKRKDHVQRHYLELHMFLPTLAFKCSKCSQKFKRRYLMENHEKVCEGANGQSYQCAVCQMIYKSRNKLINHLNKVHSIY